MGTRIIPCLLIKSGGLVKSVKFKNYKYIGDPINAVKIFNDKEVNEIAVLDIDATRDGRGPNFDFIKDIASEAFMPMAYGGGITNIDQIKAILYSGVEKVILNRIAHLNTQLITQAANIFGNQSVVLSMDVKRNWRGKYQIFTNNGKKKADVDAVIFAKKIEDAGAGEIFLNSIDRDGTFNGYDYDLIQKISAAVKIPIIACGGAGSINDFKKAITFGASAAAAGSMFVFQRPHRAVLISYPSPEQLNF